MSKLRNKKNRNTRTILVVFFFIIKIFLIIKVYNKIIIKIFIYKKNVFNIIKHTR